jgi:hypothetical protein
MIVDLIPRDPPRRDLNASYKLRGRFWLCSVTAHIAWVAVAVHIPLSAPNSKRPIYDQFIRPLESKVLIYRPPKKVADAAPEKKLGESPDPKGKLVAPRTVIAAAKNARSKQQMIWKPVDLPELKVDVPAPTVVARIETALPPPPKLAPKQFIPPSAAKNDPKLSTPEIKTALNDTPTVSVVQPTPSAPKAILPPPPKVAPKQFTPPPPSERQPKLAIQTEVNASLAPTSPLVVAQNGLVTPSANLPPPPKVAPKQFKAPPPSGAPKQPTRTEVTGTLASAPQINSGTVGAGTPAVAFSRIPAPPKDLPPSPDPTRGNEQANIAIASVNPNPAAAVPVNPRSGQFSVAPATGEAASGAASAGALTVPNLAVREPAAAAKPGLKSNTLVYTERVRPSFSSVFTVPLRPAGRSLPKTVEPHFVGRSVYAVVVPFENFPAYGTDWILWFAEASPTPGPAPSLRPPVPTRKIELVEASRDTNDTRVQISASLSSEGRLSNVKVLSAVSATVQALAIEDLSSWEWKPATRNNAAISIEAVFEIPFRLAARP